MSPLRVTRGRPAKWAQAAGDRGLVLGRLHHRADLLIAGCGLGAEIDDAVFGEGVAVVALGAGVGGGRVAGDQMVNREGALN